MKQTYFLYTWLVITMCLSSLSHADDIEIYTDYAGDQGAENHNILFTVDTSGSMSHNVTTVYTGGNYDPEKTYGDGSNTDRVYIYDTSLQYTGESFLLAQSKCASMNSLFGTSSRYPVHSTTIAQWQKTTDTVVVPGDCKNKYEQPKHYNTQGTIKKNKTFKYYVPAVPGRKFEVRYRGGDDKNKVQNMQIFSTNSKNKNKQIYCKPSNKQREFTCYGTVSKSDQERLWIQFKSKNKNNINFNVEFYIHGGQVEVCDPDTEEKRNTNDWGFSLTGSDSLDNVIECKADAGTHGISDTSSLKYAQDCPHGVVCNSPRYTSSSSSKITFLRPTQLFIPGNFHNYLQEGGKVEDLSALPEKDGESFCKTKSNRDIVFIDTDTRVIFQCKQKLEVMKTAIENIIDTLEDAPINIGLQRFNSNGKGGTVIDAVESITDNKDDFLKKLRALPADGVTPLQESLWEAYLYFSGGKRNQGYTPGTAADATDKYATLSSDYYKTPITTACQTNNVILLTDGEPYSDQGQRTNIQNLSGESCGSSSGACLDELAGAMSRLDLVKSIDGHNSVRTYTIGFDIDLPLLVDTANKGSGQNFTASDTNELTLAFQNIIIDILSDASTFVAPAVSVNAFNELRHRNELYFALFKPNAGPSWNGNVKKYRLEDRVIVDANGNEAVDSETGFFKDTAKSIWSDDIDGQSVTLGGTASRLSNERRLFTETPSGIEQLDLNFAAKLESSTLNDTIKNAFGSVSLQTNRFSPKNVIDWMLGQDVLNTNGNNSTTDANNFIGDALHNKPVVITYGGNSSDPQDVLFYMTNLGVLHAVNPNDASGTELWAYWPEEHRNNAAVYMDPGNQYEHEYGLDGEMTFVIEEKAGSTSENFQVENVQMYFGERRGGSHYYALDVSNARTTAFGAAAKLDKSYDTPFKVLWKITGALKADGDRTDADYINGNITPGFEDLAQTWSKPYHAKIKSTDKEYDVLIFSGGYDPEHDNTSYSSANVKDDESEYGNAVYIVDRETGKLLWSIGNNQDNRKSYKHSEHADLQYSIPSTPSVIDINRDGYVDMIFFVDIAGNVWRTDIDSQLSASNEEFITVGNIAQLSETKENRKFFNSVDVSLSSIDTGSQHLNIVVGSGFRASPRHKETYNNRLYVLFDKNLSKPTVDEDEDEEDRYNYFEYSNTNDDALARQVEPNDLLSIKFGEDEANVFTKRLDSLGKETDYTINGYYFDFVTSEKLMQSTTTLEGIAFFATYLPTGGSNVGSCGGGQLGSSRFYAVDLRTGKPYVKIIESRRPGLPPEISYIIPQDPPKPCELTDTCDPEPCDPEVNDECKEEEPEKNNSILVLLGPETIDVDIGKIGVAKKTYWREEKE